MTVAKHAALKLYLTRLYSMLVKMHYLEPSMINQPPHAGFDRDMWIASGIDPEAVDLLADLPYIADAYELGSDLIPGGPWFPYGGKGAFESRADDYPREPTCGHGAKLESHVVSLTCGGTDEHWLLYDITDETVIDWQIMRDDDYRDLKKRPVEEYFEEAIQNLTTLEWLAEPERGSLVTRADADIFLLHEKSDAKAVDKIFHRRSANEYRAMRKIYLDHGWPNALDGEAFKQAFRDLKQACREIEMARRWQPTEADKMELQGRLLQLFKSMAGDDAVH